MYESEAAFEPLAASVPFPYVPMSVAFEPPESVARWKRSVKPAFVLPVPPFEMVAESETGVPAVAVEGVMEPAVRSEETGAVTVRLLPHG